MSTRTRTRSSGRTYTARLHQRIGVPRRARRTPPRLSGLGFALVALGAELGHLAAALVEWPASPTRGVLHILAAVALGFVAAQVYFGRTRGVIVLGIGIGAALPAAWLAGTLSGVAPYQDYPLWIAMIVTALELVLAAMLVRSWRAQASTRGAAQQSPGRRKSGGRGNY